MFKGLYKDFREFLSRGNVVDLAVGVVIGSAFGSVVTSLVKDFITPLVAAIGGQPNFGGLSFKFHHSVFNYGDFINTAISFLIISLVIFLFVVKPVNTLIKRVKQKAGEDNVVTFKCPECLSDIPIGAKKCAYCLSPVQSAKDNKS